MTETQRDTGKNAERSGIDLARIFVKAGDGGNGAASFRREKFVPLGGPDGGDGGRGGSVYLRGDPGMDTLLEFSHHSHFRAGRGGHGRGKKMHGKKGEDVVIGVPLGTVIGTEEGFFADISRAGEVVMVARGGRGGLGNVHFATSTNQAPRVAQRGEPAEERWLRLELKTIADIGLVGFPNAGKSSLLAAASRAHPKIAAYPFTTLTPNLGVAERPEVNFTIADIPGLIEGAHLGAGLGHRFLRHIERARLLLHVVDGSAENPIGDLEALRRELELYDRTLIEKPSLVAVNKLDLPAASERWPEMRAACEARKVSALGISALTGQGILELLEALSERLAGLPVEASPEREQVRVYRLGAEDDVWWVERQGDLYLVHGKRIERMANMTDDQNPEAIELFQRTLRKMGILDALEQAGAEPGDTVSIGRFEVEWGE
ncbi:MAG: GTPase ObgE [Chloroflexi bacterium]|nr:GTPase ObgE [Chloroflexota bacterium]